MSLTVTVQKGHDFSSGNVTRAALNAGAVPTVAVTGSVGTSELAAGSVTGTELKSSSSEDGDRAVTTNHIQDDAVTTAKIADDAVDLDKLHYSAVKGAIIRTGDNAAADAVVPTVLDAKTAGKILIGDGVDLLSLGDQSGNVEDTTVIETQPKSHVAIGIEARDSAPSTGVLLTLKDFAIKVVKLAKNKVAGTLTPGIIVYDNVGEASVLASTGTDSRVLTTNDTATPSFKVINKVVPLLGTGGRTTFGAVSTPTTAHVFVGAHGLTSPKSVSVYLEVVAGATDEGYSEGDRIPLLQLMINAQYNTVAWDGTNVMCHTTYAPFIHPKSSTALDTTATPVYIAPEKWKVIALVSE